MNPSPLSELADIRLPEDPGWWPPAPGWWILAGLFTLLLALLGWMLWRRYRQRAWQRQALSELELLERQSCPDRETLAALDRLLRRAAITAKVPGFSANLAGSEWRNWLLGHDFTSERAAQCLSEHRYRPDLRLDDDEWQHIVSACRHWLSNLEANDA